MKICAITTTYYPDETTILENFNRIKDFIDKYIIIDNSNSYQFKILNLVNEIVIIQNNINYGVAKGINLGIDESLKYNPTHLILFDQDSLSDINMMKIMVDTISLLEDIEIIVPNIIDNITSKEIHKKHFNLNSSEIKSIESTQLSGMMVKYDILKNHKFDENYFLNLIDSEWCWRVTNSEHKIFLQPKAKLHHSFGEGKKSFLNYSFYYGKPFRMYYTSRDILYAIQFSRASSKRKLILCAKFFISWFEVLLLDNKIERWKYLARGIIHYLKGIRGRGIEI